MAMASQKEAGESQFNHQLVPALPDTLLASRLEELGRLVGVQEDDVLLHALRSNGG